MNQRYITMVMQFAVWNIQLTFIDCWCSNTIQYLYKISFFSNLLFDTSSIIQSWVKYPIQKQFCNLKKASILNLFSIWGENSPFVPLITLNHQLSGITLTLQSATYMQWLVHPTDCRKNKNFTHKLSIAHVTFTTDHQYELIQLS